MRYNYVASARAATGEWQRHEPNFKLQVTKSVPVPAPVQCRVYLSHCPFPLSVLLSVPLSVRLLSSRANKCTAMRPASCNILIRLTPLGASLAIDPNRNRRQRPSLCCWGRRGKRGSTAGKCHLTNGRITLEKSRAALLTFLFRRTANGSSNWGWVHVQPICWRFSYNLSRERSFWARTWAKFKKKLVCNCLQR